jgi:gamma-glutamylcyclotransferase (GGCT)/AIG2-like uncharacterized protein YtfP
MGPEHRLIVYGSLAPGKSNHAQMDGMAGTWTPGVVQGHFHDAGWGAGEGFPGLTPDPAGPAVEVLVFASDDLPAHWARLDAFEGEDYRRVVVEVEIGGAILPANIYAVAP